MGFGRAVVQARFLVVAVWVAVAVCLSPFAIQLLSRIKGGFSQAPPGTESYEALNVFERHFTDLSTVRTEKILLYCVDPCETVVTKLSKGIMEYIHSELVHFNTTFPDAVLHIESYYTFQEHHAEMIMGKNQMLSDDKQSMLLQWVWRPRLIEAGAKDFIEYIQSELKRMNEMTAGRNLKAKLTGLFTMDVVLKRTLVKEIMLHEAKTIWAPFLVLAFALKSPRMLLLALIPMGLEMPIGLGIMYFVSLKTTVLLYAVEMMFMLMTALSFDYALFLLTRYAEERRNGAEVEDAINVMISSVGRVILTSGIVLIISWASMLGLPSLFMSFSLASGCMIVVCVMVQLTFVPALLAIFPCLGPPKGEGAPVVTNGQAHDREPGLDAPLMRNREAARNFEVIRGGNSFSSSKDSLSPSRSARLTSPTNGSHDIHSEAKADGFRKTAAYRLGGCLTTFPLNIIVLLMVYVGMLPLSKRFFKNFDIYQFRFNMGHLFENQVPRGTQEWSVAQRVQTHFPNAMGVLMPAMIIATRDVSEKSGRELQEAPASGTAPAFFPALQSGVASAQNWLGQAQPEGELPPTTVAPGPNESTVPVDVRGQAFFDANCHMLNTVLRSTQNMSLKLTAGNFVSLTVHGLESDGSMKCQQFWQLQFINKGGWLQRTFLKQTSQLANLAWTTMVSARNDAMISFVFPPVDPFGSEAFKLAEHLRSVLKTESQDPAVPGLKFWVFSPATALMDLINLTEGSLPSAFSICCLICVVLVAWMFGSPFIPIKLVLTVLVPITWTYGAALYVYEDGVLTFLHMPFLSPPSEPGLDWSVPVFTLTFLVGVAIDYDIFLYERVVEFKSEGFDGRESISLGLAATGGIIAAAGIIMALSFGGSTLLGSVPNTNQLGFTIVLAILLISFLVQPIVVPSLLSLFYCGPEQAAPDEDEEDGSDDSE